MQFPPEHGTELSVRSIISVQTLDLSLLSQYISRVLQYGPGTVK